MNDKVMVVGGAGYVGCVLVEVLLAKGYSVKVFDRMFFGRRAHRGASRIASSCSWRTCGDLEAHHLADCGAVINIGGLSNDPTAEFDPKANAELNTTPRSRSRGWRKRPACLG